MEERSQDLPECQEFSDLTTSELEELEKIVNEKYAKLQSKLPNTRYDNETVTSAGNLFFVNTFKKHIGFQDMVSKALHVPRGDNVSFSTEEIIDFLTDCIFVGFHRFSHQNQLGEDPGYRRMKNKSSFPDESTTRKFLKRFKKLNIEELKGLNSTILARKAELHGPRRVWLSIDDSALTLYGKQEKGEFGYNPHRKGSPSYKMKVAFVNGSKELVNASLLSGNAKGTTDITEFLDQTFNFLPREWVPEGLLLDRDFFSEDLLEELEERQLKYMVKARMYSTLKRHALSIPEEEWEYVGNDYYVTEKVCRLDSWEHERRFVFIRKRIDSRKAPEGQLSFEEMKAHTYRYEAIVTNVEPDESTPLAVWQEYNQRSVVENNIEELKEGFAVRQASQQKFLQNYSYMFIKVIAYNLIGWFMDDLMPSEFCRVSVRTLRRIFINRPANIVKRGGRKLTIRLAPDKIVKRIIEAIKDRWWFFLMRESFAGFA